MSLQAAGDLDGPERRKEWATLLQDPGPAPVGVCGAPAECFKGKLLFLEKHL